MGAFKCDQVIGVVERLLQACCLGVCQATDMLGLFADTDVVIPWYPAPMQGRRPCSLQLTRDGMASMEQAPDCCMSQVVAACDRLGVRENPRPLAAIVVRLSCDGSRQGTSLFRQLLTSVAQLWEEALLRGDMESCCQLVDTEGPGRSVDRHLEAILLEHMRAARDAVGSEPKFLSMATDKSSVGSYRLQDSVIVLPDNTAMLPPPMAFSLVAQVLASEGDSVTEVLCHTGLLTHCHPPATTPYTRQSRN